MKITEIEYQGQNLILNLEGDQKIDIFPDFRFSIDKKKEYRVLSIHMDESTVKIKLNLGIYRKAKQMNCRMVSLNEFTEILLDYGIV